MEVRCGKCNKLFRVSDDKITGKGVKFSCTRCGEYVRITREDFENYSLARSAVSTLDTFRSEEKPAIDPGPKMEPSASRVEAGIAEAAGAAPKTTEPSSTDIPDFLQERQEPPSPLSDPLEKSTPVTEQTSLKEPMVPSAPVQEAAGAELVKKPEVPGEPEPQPEPVVAADSKPEPAREPAAEPEPESAGNKGQDSVLKSSRDPEETTLQAPAGKPETPAVPSAETAPTAMAKPPAGAVSTVARVSGPEQQAAPKKEHDHAAVALSPKPETEASVSRPVRSSRMFLVTAVSAIVLALAGIGVYLYVQSSQRAAQESGPGMISTEGLQIINTAGSLDANGDLLVSGVLENLTNQERADWYIVVEVFDSQGKALSTLRMLNGRQIYTKRDYEILAQRGENVQQLKETVLQPRGIVLPPKWRESFEIRYLQPPVGVASFNAALQTVDRARLVTEIEAETK